MLNWHICIRCIHFARKYGKKKWNMIEYHNKRLRVVLTFVDYNSNIK